MQNYENNLRLVNERDRWYDGSLAIELLSHDRATYKLFCLSLNSEINLIIMKVIIKQIHFFLIGLDHWLELISFGKSISSRSHERTWVKCFHICIRDTYVSQSLVGGFPNVSRSFPQDIFLNILMTHKSLSTLEKCI